MIRILLKREGTLYSNSWQEYNLVSYKHSQMCFTDVIAQGFKKKKKKEKICEKEANNEFKDTHKTRKFKRRVIQVVFVEKYGEK